MSLRNGLILACCLSLMACADKPVEKEVEHGRLVKAVELVDDDLGSYRSYPGRVNASEKVDLAFEVEGKLIELPISEGLPVKKDALLARLDPRDFQNNVDKKQARYDLAKATFERYAQLLKTNTVAKADYDEKQALFKIAKAELSIAHKSLQDTKLTAPFEGIIATRFVENYQFIQTKQPILSLHNVSDIEVVINIPEQDVARADQIERLQDNESKGVIVGKATFAALPGHQYSVKIKEFKTTADPKTQTYRTTLIMRAPDRRIILPGMTANVKIKFTSRDEAYFYVPVTSVKIDKEGKSYVWRILPDKMSVTKVLVSAGEMSGSEIGIKDGIESGDQIVTAGGDYLLEGEKIRILTGKIGQ